MTVATLEIFASIQCSEVLLKDCESVWISVAATDMMAYCMPARMGLTSEGSANRKRTLEPIRRAMTVQQAMKSLQKRDLGEAYFGSFVR